MGMVRKNVAYLNLDGAFPSGSIDVRKWGPKLRYTTTHRTALDFWWELSGHPLPPYIVYGSGDFHHLTYLLLRRFQRPLHVISFDNHPDTIRDIDPWCCGTWVSQMLDDMPATTASVWGCGSDILCGEDWGRGNVRAVKDKRLTIWPWYWQMDDAADKRMTCITKTTWRGLFLKHLLEAKRDVYLTLDLDCLHPEHFQSNWDQGEFTPDDILWAINAIRTHCNLIGADVCGFFTPPRYATKKQRREIEREDTHIVRCKTDGRNQRVLEGILNALGA